MLVFVILMYTSICIDVKEPYLLRFLLCSVGELASGLPELVFNFQSELAVTIMNITTDIFCKLSIPKSLETISIDRHYSGLSC